ncbi:MAG: ATPase domain-containing protein [archaeon]
MNNNTDNVESQNANPPFFLKSGKKISELNELKDYLLTIQPGEFHHHVTSEKNDFESWIRHGLKEEELANKVINVKIPEELIAIIKQFLNAGLEQAKEQVKPDETASDSKTISVISEFIPEQTYIKTDVPGFDELITNGIPKESAVLVCGGPGTGKTTFCLNLICNAAKKGSKCLYLTFEEDIINLKRHMKNFGWDGASKGAAENMIVKKMQPFDISRSVEALLAKASGELTIELDEVEGVIPSGFHPDIIILDSLSAVAAAFSGKEEGYRIYIEQLFSLFKKIGATSFLITEIEQDTTKYSKSGIEEFLADAVIVFYNIRSKNIRINALEILKARGTPHQKKIVPFKIVTNKGIVVYPTEEVFT